MNGKKGKSTTLSSKSYLIGIHSPSDRSAGQAPGQEEQFVLLSKLNISNKIVARKFPLLFLEGEPVPSIGRSDVVLQQIFFFCKTYGQIRGW